MADNEPQVIDHKTAIAEVRAAMEVEAGRLADMQAAAPERQDDPEFGIEVRQARDRVITLDARWTALSRLVTPEPPNGQGPQAATAQTSQPAGHRSMGQQVTEADEYKQWRERAQGSVEVRTLITGPGDTAFTSGGAFAPIMPYVIAPPAVRRDRLVVRDLLPQTTTTYEVINYIGETYVSGSDADVVAEGAAKPEVAMNWFRASVNVKKIAAWVPATSESLADYGQLRGAIDNRLTYKLLRREETELLSGDGTGAHQLGLLHAVGLQTQAFSTNVVTTIAKAEALLENVDGSASGIVMNPADFWSAMAATSTTLTGARPFESPPESFWGLPAVRTPRIAANTALIGDFKQAAELFDREDVSIRVGDQHSDYFVSNKVAILAEKREALVIYRGDLFVNITSLS